MKVKEWVDGGLILDGDVMEGADEAFRDGRYIEAFALLHCLIDWWMADLYQLYRITKGLGDIDWLNMVEKHEYRFKSTLKFLSGSGVISRQEHKRLYDFNELRNRVVHRLIVHSYQPGLRNKVTRAEAIHGFEEGKALVTLLRERTGHYIPSVAKLELKTD
jgi:hypothetical protein